MSVRGDPAFYKPLHIKYGCYGCMYADAKHLGLRACCTVRANLGFSDDGRCLDRKEEKEAAHAKQ